MTLPGRVVLLGHPLGHSLSPRIQNAALRAAGIPLEYEALDVTSDHFDDTVAQLRAAGAAGNVTIPYKERMAAACNHLTAIAQRAGAVNTFWMEAGELTGGNSDVAAFDAAARELLGWEPHGLSVGVIGAGGGAAAVLTAVERWPLCKAVVYNRTADRARALVERFRAFARASDDADVLARVDLVVNATPQGLRDDQIPVDPARLARDAAVLDLAYRAPPDDTPWVRAARVLDHPARDGKTMLVEQGALAFERWFGVAPDRSVMWRALAEG